MEDTHNEWLRLQPLIEQTKEKLKRLKKEQKASTKAIYEHMDENGLSTYDVGTFTFRREEAEHCPYNRKNMEEILEDQGVLERYRDAFTETKTKYNIKKST